MVYSENVNYSQGESYKGVPMNKQLITSQNESTFHNLSHTGDSKLSFEYKFIDGENKEKTPSEIANKILDEIKDEALINNPSLPVDENGKAIIHISVKEEDGGKSINGGGKSKNIPEDKLRKIEENNAQYDRQYGPGIGRPLLS